MRSPTSTAPKAAAFTWAFPGSPLKVSLDLNVVATVQRNPGTAGKRGTARQALLLGEITDSSTKITGMIPVADLHSSLVEAVRAAGPAGVGLFRYRSEGSLQPTVEESSAARNLFHRPGAVILLAQPVEKGPAQATFFFFERNLLCGGYLQFPLDASALADREAPPPRHEVRPTPSADRLPRLASRWFRRVALGSVAVAAMAGGAALTRIFRPAPVSGEAPKTIEVSPAGQTIQTIELHAERQGNDLKLTWDRPPAPAESSGMLSITDGLTRRLIPLEPAQLQYGSVLYSATSQEVKVDLTVSHGNQVDGRGSVLVLVGGTEAPRVVRQPIAPPQPAPASYQPPPKPEAQAETRSALRPFVATQGARTEPRVDLALPPTAGAQQPTPAVKFPGVEFTPVQPAPAPPAPPAGSAPTPAQTVPMNYVEPAAIYKVVPQQPSELRSVLGRDTKVLVKVQIDEKGRVTKAEPILEKGVHQLLVGAAVRAAVNWRFSPARLADKPVRSEMTLEFRFARQ